MCDGEGITVARGSSRVSNGVVPYTHWSLFDDETSARACAAELGTDYRSVVRRSQVEDAWPLFAGRDVRNRSDVGAARRGR